MRTPDEPRKQKVTAFLIKDGYESIANFVNSIGFDTVDVTHEGQWHGTLIYRGGFRRKPAWVSLFEEIPGFDHSKLFTQSAKALYVLKREGRWFCFTFGHSRQLINELSFERNFGLIVALNLGDPAAIRSIEKTSISHVALQSREQAAKEIELTNFEFDNDTDLLKSITARSPSTDGKSSDTVSGRDSVTIYTDITIDKLTEIAGKLYAAFKDTSYKTRYPWLDQVREERDEAITSELESELARRIGRADFRKIWLAIPELVNWEEIAGFGFTRGSRDSTRPGPVTYHDLDIEEWHKRANIATDLSFKQLASKRVFVHWADDREPSTWGLYRCINAEIEHGGRTYILNDGDWYNIEQGYVAEINQYYATIPDSRVSLPPHGVYTEPEYLAHVAKNQTQYALMDRQTVMIGSGRSRVEFCDLYSAITRTLIHVKKYGGSSVLSHLFSQAVVSAESFLYEQRFREEVNKLLPTQFKLADAQRQPVAQDYEICMAIMSKVDGPLELPFFSKVSLKHAAKTLRNLGYRVTKLKIER